MLTTVMADVARLLRVLAAHLVPRPEETAEIYLRSRGAPGALVYTAGRSPAFRPREESVGYTTRGYIEHFLPDREVNLAALNKALADVFGEPALRGKQMELSSTRNTGCRSAATPGRATSTSTTSDLCPEPRRRYAPPADRAEWHLP